MVAAAHHFAGADSERASVTVNESTIYSSRGQDIEIRDLLWSGSCDRLMFLELGAAGTTFVVVRGSTVEARLPLPDDVGYTTEYQSGETFLITGRSKSLVYDIATRTLKPGDAALRAKREREAVVERLGGREPNWWTPPAR